MAQGSTYNIRPQSPSPLGISVKIPVTSNYFMTLLPLLNIWSGSHFTEHLWLFFWCLFPWAPISRIINTLYLPITELFYSFLVSTFSFLVSTFSPSSFSNKCSFFAKRMIKILTSSNFTYRLSICCSFLFYSFILYYFLKLKYFIVCAIIVVPIFPPLPPPPSPPPIPTVNPYTIVHGPGSFVCILWLIPSPSFSQSPPAPSLPFSPINLFHVSMPLVLFYLLVYCVHWIPFISEIIWYLSSTNSLISLMFKLICTCFIIFFHFKFRFIF